MGCVYITDMNNRKLLAVDKLVDDRHLMGCEMSL